MKKKTGVWIDRKKAVIVNLKEETHSAETVYSLIESRERIPGQGKLFARFGKQFMDFEKKKQNRMENKTKKFCREVITKISGADQVVIFGPSEMKRLLKTALQEDINLSQAQINLETADDLTDNQIIAWVKDYYGL